MICSPMSGLSIGKVKLGLRRKGGGLGWESPFRLHSSHDAAFEFVSHPVVLERGHWCHSNRLWLSFRLTPISSGWGEEKWGEIQKPLKNFVKKFTFFQIVA